MLRFMSCDTEDTISVMTSLALMKVIHSDVHRACKSQELKNLVFMKFVMDSVPFADCPKSYFIMACNSQHETNAIIINVHKYNYVAVYNYMPILVVAWSKAYDLRFVAGNAGSNPARGMDVCFCVSLLYCPVLVEAFATS
jgi:hypothetical protein